MTWPRATESPRSNDYDDPIDIATSDDPMASLELLRKFASAKLPVRLVAADEFNGARELAALGYIKLSAPPMKKGRGSYGQPEATLVLAITQSGKRAISA
jgi:hypothetical protein